MMSSLLKESPTVLPTFNTPQGVDIEEHIKSTSATLVDVRTAAEFQRGHVLGSTNIPMQEVPLRLDEFRQMSKPIILFCAAGQRSGHVAEYLHQLGVEEVYNGGRWEEVDLLLNGS